MIRDDGRRVVSVDLGPELYSQICQVHALFGVGKTEFMRASVRIMMSLFGVGKTEFMRASVRIMMSLIATVSKAGGITQREATRAVLESMPPITGVDIEDIRMDPRMEALLNDILQTISTRDDTMESGNAIGMRDDEVIEQGVSH